MKFAITGVHGTGKTTLVEALEKTGQFPEFKFITNQTRSLRNKVVINENADDNTQLAVLEVTSKTAMIENSIDDRCILDTLAYTLGLYRRKRVSEFIVMQVVNSFNRLIGNYTALFYLPPEIPFIKDGVRSEDLEWRNDLIGVFERTLSYVSIPTYVIVGTVEERVLQTSDIIDQYTTLKLERIIR